MQPSSGSSRTAIQPPPVKNLRITLWGCQGSCPIFPAPHEVSEYTRRVQLMALSRAIEDVTQHAKDGIVNVKELFGSDINEKSINAYLKKLAIPELPVYGGETTCVEVETSDGNILIFDGGSGIRHCALSICKKWESRANRTLHIFGSHQHLDHRSGLPFAKFCFMRDNPFNLHIYGSREFLIALDSRFGLFSKEVSATAHLDDPLDFRFMAANFEATQIKVNKNENTSVGSGLRPWASRDMQEVITIGNTTVTPFDTYHGDCPCLGYKIEHNGASFIFCTDHELRHGTDPSDARQLRSEAAEARIVELSRNADLGYFDGQYFLTEYLGQKGINESTPAAVRRDWGHSCVEDVIARALKCNIKHTLIGHHDPEREWPDRIQMDADFLAMCQGKPNQFELAKGSMVIDL
jgi:hypothetical protein